MKKTSITALIMLILCISGIAQTTVINPKTGFSTANNVQITKVELTDTATILSFDVKYTPKWWINIPLETYIQPVNSTEKFRVKYSEGIALNKRFFMPESGKTSYRLFFDALPKGTDVIDFNEDAEGAWKIYDIILKQRELKLILPKELYTNWFSTATGDLELSINDKFAVYKNKLWNINQFKAGKDASTISLSSKEGKTAVLYCKPVNANTCLFGESATELKQYSNNSSEALKTAVIDNEPYKLPIFKLDSATYSGCFIAYNKRIGMKTMSLNVSDIITGRQETHLITIDENGYFSIKVPLYNPQYCFVSVSFHNSSVLLEPGKSLFVLIDYASKSDNELFMGELAKLNTDLKKMTNIRNFNYDVMRKKILEMSAEQYKAFCREAQEKDMTALNEMANKTKISAKAFQVKKLDIAYSAMANMMFYKMNYESAYRDKNKIPRTQRELDIKIDSLTDAYFDFLTPESLKNPIAVVAPNYSAFINWLKYLDIFRPKIDFNFSILQLAEELTKAGFEFTPSEQEMLTKQKKVDSIVNAPEQKEFNVKFGELKTKYKSVFDSIYKKMPKANADAIAKYLKENKIKLTSDEKKLIKEMSKAEKSDEVKMIRDFYGTYKDSINAFLKKHSEFRNEYLNNRWQEGRNEKIKSMLNIDSGIAFEFMKAQDLTRKITGDIQPVSEQKLKTIQQQFTTPFIVEYIAVCNNNAIAKLEANKTKTGYTVNEIPKTEADKMFDAMMQKFRGKVVYVDFWATWCAPCRSGIERIKPLKEEMDLSKVAFVYITNPSSPLTTWNNMIPDIKGEHYRVSDDEWNYLKSKFQITGIPHYVLVGKKGEVLKPKLEHMDNDGIKSMLEKYIKE